MREHEKRCQKAMATENIKTFNLSLVISQSFLHGKRHIRHEQKRCKNTFLMTYIFVNVKNTPIIHLYKAYIGDGGKTQVAFTFIFALDKIISTGTKSATLM